MTPEKVREVIGIYRKKFKEMDIPKKEDSSCSRVFFNTECLAHCHSMLDKMEGFIEEDNRMDKVFRWLGFIQGCLWMGGIYTVREIKNHNRPSECAKKQKFEFGEAT